MPSQISRVQAIVSATATARQPLNPSTPDAGLRCALCGTRHPPALDIPCGWASPRLILLTACPTCSTTKLRSLFRRAASPEAATSSSPGPTRTSRLESKPQLTGALRPLRVPQRDSNPCYYSLERPGDVRSTPSPALLRIDVFAVAEDGDVVVVDDAVRRAGRPPVAGAEDVQRSRLPVREADSNRADIHE